MIQREDQILIYSAQTDNACVTEVALWRDGGNEPEWRADGSSKRAPGDVRDPTKGRNLAVLRALRKLVKQLEGEIGPDALDALAAPKPLPDVVVTVRADTSEFDAAMAAHDDARSNGLDCPVTGVSCPIASCIAQRHCSSVLAPDDGGDLAGWAESAQTVDAAGATDHSGETKQESAPTSTRWDIIASTLSNHVDRWATADATATMIERALVIWEANHRPAGAVPAPVERCGDRGSWKEGGCVRPLGHPRFVPSDPTSGVGCSTRWRPEDGPEPSVAPVETTEPAVTAESPACARWINVECLDRGGRSLVSLTPFLNGGAVWLPPGTAKIQLSKP